MWINKNDKQKSYAADNMQLFLFALKRKQQWSFLIYECKLLLGKTPMLLGKL